MSPEPNDLTLDLERCHKIQETIDLLEQLMASESRSRVEYAFIRHRVLDATGLLWEAASIYQELIPERRREQRAVEGEQQE